MICQVCVHMEMHGAHITWVVFNGIIRNWREAVELCVHQPEIGLRGCMGLKCSQSAFVQRFEMMNELKHF